jgi:gliding motility-associated-like protein
VWSIVPAVPPTPIQENVIYCIGESINIDAGIEDGDYLYSLFFEEINADNLLSSNDYGSFNISDSGTHYLVITEPQCGFSTFAPFEATYEICEIKIPNVFSPNEDGKNEAFVIDGVENYPGSTLLIYDRWGTLVYESANYNNSWTGKDQADGTYYFIFGHNLDSGMVYYEGHLTLLRK